MSDSTRDGSSEQQGNSLYAALARTATRSMALYFSRPMRLFRPSKVSGWHLLKGLATHEGAALTPRYLADLVKQQGFLVIPRHFIPPVLVNAALGTVLWATYSETSSYLEPHFEDGSVLVSTVSGAAAGSAQALLAAPAENVRLVLEGGTQHKGWSYAWKEVFRGTAPPPGVRKDHARDEARRVRNWMNEVGGMAGRGWDGWGWGCAKDACGFAAFFTVFEITRRVALNARGASQTVLDRLSTTSDLYTEYLHPFERHFPRTIHGATLVAGGVGAGLSYELVSRPWDVARKSVHSDRATHCGDFSLWRTLVTLVERDGVMALFRDPVAGSESGSDAGGKTRGRRRMYAAMRTLARVGPWGIGFLAWEVFGPGLS